MTSLVLFCLMRTSLQSASRVHCNIAFGELVVNFSDSHIRNSIDTIVPVLIDILRNIPYTDFDKSLSWQGATHPHLYCDIAKLLFRLGSSRSACFLYYICSPKSLE
jgi:hypothetical protein